VGVTDGHLVQVGFRLRLCVNYGEGWDDCWERTGLVHVAELGSEVDNADDGNKNSRR